MQATTHFLPFLTFKSWERHDSVLVSFIQVIAKPLIPLILKEKMLQWMKQTIMENRTRACTISCWTSEESQELGISALSSKGTTQSGHKEQRQNQRSEPLFLKAAQPSRWHMGLAYWRLANRFSSAHRTAARSNIKPTRWISKLWFGLLLHTIPN